MKSLWKISRRYILTAVFITVFVVFVNLAVFIYMAYTSITEGENQNSGMTVRQNMEKISSRIHRQGEGYGLSQEGYDILKETSFQWAMLLDRDGKAVWEYALPKGSSPSRCWLHPAAGIWKIIRSMSGGMGTDFWYLAAARAAL